MATYVLSDIHGHANAFKEVLEKASPGTDDTIYLLGDMGDRGPAPLEVMQTVRSIPNMKVLLGNHEDMLLNSIANPRNEETWTNWMWNGGGSTVQDLLSLTPEEFNDLMDWVRDLPRYFVTEVGGQLYVLVHAGIRPEVVNAPADGPWTKPLLLAMLAEQDPVDLTWIREGFWDRPTGLVNEKGEGPIVIAGHTPTIYMESFASDFDGQTVDADGRGIMVAVGASEATGGRPDKVGIDACAAAGAGIGQVGMVCLDNGEVFYAPIREGE